MLLDKVPSKYVSNYSNETSPKEKTKNKHKVSMEINVSYLTKFDQNLLPFTWLRLLLKRYICINFKIQNFNIIDLNENSSKEKK